MLYQSVKHLLHTTWRSNRLRWQDRQTTAQFWTRRMAATVKRPTFLTSPLIHVDVFGTPYPPFALSSLFCFVLVVALVVVWRPYRIFFTMSLSPSFLLDRKPAMVCLFIYSVYSFDTTICKYISAATHASLPLLF